MLVINLLAIPKLNDDGPNSPVQPSDVCLSVREMRTS